MDRTADWIVEYKLLACAFPRNPETLAELASSGIRLCVNLHEQRLPSEQLSPLGLVELHLPVPDFTAPPQDVVRDVVRAIDAALAAGHPVAINCGAGLGRTGTVAAAWLVSQGVSADEAIKQVRTRRPGSIETPEQEAAVRLFAESFT